MVQTPICIPGRSIFKDIAEFGEHIKQLYASEDTSDTWALGHLTYRRQQNGIITWTFTNHKRDVYRGKCKIESFATEKSTSMEQTFGKIPSLKRKAVLPIDGDDDRPSSRVCPQLDFKGGGEPTNHRKERRNRGWRSFKKSRRAQTETTTLQDDDELPDAADFTTLHRQRSSKERSHSGQPGLTPSILQMDSPAPLGPKSVEENRPESLGHPALTTSSAPSGIKPAKVHQSVGRPTSISLPRQLHGHRGKSESQRGAPSSSIRGQKSASGGSARDRSSWGNLDLYHPAINTPQQSTEPMPAPVNNPFPTPPSTQSSSPSQPPEKLQSLLAMLQQVPNTLHDLHEKYLAQMRDMNAEIEGVVKRVEVLGKKVRKCEQQDHPDWNPPSSVTMKSENGSKSTEDKHGSISGGNCNSDGSPRRRRTFMLPQASEMKGAKSNMKNGCNLGEMYDDDGSPPKRRTFVFPRAGSSSAWA